MVTKRNLSNPRVAKFVSLDLEYLHDITPSNFIDLFARALLHR